jgi:1,4-alpha-glucan branching enzyme
MKKQISKTTAKATVTFSISAELLNGAKKASVAGEFNGWNPETNPFRMCKGVGSAKVELEKGKEYQYKFVINGEKWVNDPEADKQVGNEFGETNSVVVL